MAASLDWRTRTAAERGGILQTWASLLLQHQADLARLLTLEQGKPLAEARGEIAYAAQFFEWFAEEAKRAYGDVIPPPKRGQHVVVLKQPIGVTAAITPWNFPAAMITRKAGAALAAGCPMVIKPAEATPLSALALARLGELAGLPPGVLNVVTGLDADAIGRTLTEHEAVRMLSFTGSTEVGRILMARCARHLTKVSLELGGNAPFIVFDDADLEAAVDGAMASKFRNTGQTCVCVNRFLVQEAVHDTFVARLRDAMAALKIGDGLDDGVEQAALISTQAVEKVQAHVADALAGGATLELGGKPHPLGKTYFEPTLLTGVQTSMQCTREETFGPLAAVMRFASEDEAIRLANDTEYGLAAYFYTRDVHRIWRVAEQLETGIVGVNEGIISTPVAPFGGVKASGLGREGSRYGLEEYLELKYVCMGSEREIEA
jgi:succinate-semialdehyde dehydrogenase/glutarate-semialdehyde dehydrogenase